MILSARIMLKKRSGRYRVGHTRLLSVINQNHMGLKKTLCINEHNKASR